MALSAEPPGVAAMAPESGTPAPQRQLRRLLIFGLVCSNLLVCALCAYALFHDRQQYESRAEMLTQNVASAVDQNVSGSIDRVDLALRAVADELERQLAGTGIDHAAMAGFLERQQQRLPEVEAIRVADAAGRVILGKGLEQGQTVSWADREYFLYLRDHADGGLQISKPRMGRVARQFIVGFARRYNHPDGRFAGVISAPIAVDHFFRLLARFDLGPRGSLNLRDSDLGLIARYPAIPDKPIGAVGNSEVSRELRQHYATGVAAATYFTAESADGHQRISTFRRLDRAPMMVLVGTAREDYLAGWRTRVLQMSALGGSFLLLSLLLGGFLLHLLARAERDQRRLRDSEARYRLLSENISDVIWIIDLTTRRFSYISPSVQRLRGYTAEEIMAGPIEAALTPASAARVLGALEAKLARIATGDRSQLVDCTELEQPHRDGRIVHTEAATTLLLDESGRPVAVLGVSRDITARKETEAELERYRNQLEAMVAERTAALSVAKEAAEAANRAKSTFLANMSHELRTPMNAIVGMTNLALRRATDPRQQDQLTKVDRASQQLLTLLNDILDLSKIEAERLTLEAVVFDLQSIFDNLRNLVAPGLAEKHLQLVLDLPPDLARRPLRGDPLRLGQVLLNLTNNAIKFTAAGSIRVGIAVDDEDAGGIRLRGTVTDTGIGIAAADQPRLFAAFEQADGSMTRKYGGTGLGLAICKRLVRLMGGEIGVDSQFGSGSTFWFTVRLDQPAPLEPPQPGQTGPLAEAILRARYAGARVLLAEDEPINREVARELLEEAGLMVEIAIDGAEALTMARRAEYDLILLDLQMPKMNGIEATWAIRALPGRRMPIVALTANAFDEDRQRCLEAGMDDHIAKPVDPEALFATVQRWLAAYGGSGRDGARG